MYAAQLKFRVLLLLVVGLHCTTTNAGVIDQQIPPINGGVVSDIFTFFEDNDDLVPFANAIIFGVTHTTSGPEDIVFMVSDSLGVTEYAAIGFASNLSGNPMTQYIFELGFGTGSSFTPSPANDGLDFSIDTATAVWDGGLFALSPTSTEDRLVFNGGSFLHGALESFTITIDVPNLSQGQFTLRVGPVAVTPRIDPVPTPLPPEPESRNATAVPEPGSAAMLLTSLLLISYRRNRWSR